MSIRSPRRLGLTLFATVMLLVVCSGAAGAISGVSFSPGEAITQTGTLRAILSSTVLECPVTLSGSLMSSLITVGEAAPAVGSVSELRFGTCARGSIRTVLNVPATLTMTQPTRTVPAGSVSEILFSSNVGIRMRFSTGEECLVGNLYLMTSVEALGRNEYALGRGTYTAFCGAFTAVILEAAAVTPRQVATFLTGNEVIDGFTPRPVVFGTVRAGEVAQIAVTIGSSAGGRIEEIAVASQRYFAITDPNGCRGTTLAARGTCNINVIASVPAETGRTVTDTLTVTTAERRFVGTLRAST